MNEQPGRFLKRVWESVRPAPTVAPARAADNLVENNDSLCRLPSRFGVFIEQCANFRSSRRQLLQNSGAAGQLGRVESRICFSSPCMARM